MTSTKTEQKTEDPPSKESLEGVKERLKFFFSDANLRQDKFMRRFIWRDDGKIPIEVLLKFNSLKSHTESASTVVAAAKELPELIVSEDDQSIKRAEPFLRSQMFDNVPLSLYITGLEVENDSFKISTGEVKKLFDQYEGLALVKLNFRRVEEGSSGEDRRWRNVANGTALVEFDTVENLNKAAEELLTIKDNEPVEPKRVLELAGAKLGVQKFQEYRHSKKDNKRKSFDSVDNEDSSPEKVAETPVKSFTYDWKPGCVIKLKGLPESCDREAILSAMAKILEFDIENVKEQKIFADYSRGQSDGAIRFPSPDDVPKVLEALQETEIAGAKVESAAVLEGDEEKAYWEKFIEFKNQQLKQRAGDRSYKKKRTR